jgi:hypothetical protein
MPVLFFYIKKYLAYPMSKYESTGFACINKLPLFHLSKTFCPEAGPSYIPPPKSIII